MASKLLLNCLWAVVITMYTFQFPFPPIEHKQSHVLQNVPSLVDVLVYNFTNYILAKFPSVLP